MTALDPPPRGAVVSHATLDNDGLLLTAEPALDALNRRAGGEIGRPLAVPQLATAARLARRLGIVVSRGVIVADESGDVELWVRVQPEGEGLRLAASGWHERPAWTPTVGRGEAGRDFLAADADWCWECDATLRLTRIAIAAGRRHGFDAIALLGQPVTALFELAAGEAIIDALARHQPFVDAGARVRATSREVLLSATVRTDAAGRFGGFIGVARQVEEPAAPPEQVPLAPAFTAGLDRALRRPLAQIVANADSIGAATDGPVGPDYAGYAADIAQAGRHLLAMVDDLVDLQAVERPDFMPATDRIDLADVVGRAAGLLAVRASEAAVLIERPLPGVRLWARGDFRRALQILVNLLGNALRYAPRGSIVLVGLDRRGDQVAVSVTDEGKGIAPADQARVFEKFERVDPGEPGGNGLGLYIARRLARAMGGDLTLASIPGEGARFTLSLPVALAEPAGDEDQR